LTELTKEFVHSITMIKLGAVYGGSDM
jgi:hypothetical protein